MYNTKGYFIVDENKRYVVGYVKCDEGTRYVSYDKNDSCCVRPFKTEQEALDYILTLNQISKTLQDGHYFNYITL